MPPISDRLSLSTCWCSGRHTDGYEMVAEMVALGFRRIELSHGIRISLVPGILRAVDENLVTVGSLHNFCPLPTSVQHAAPNLYEPSARDHRERDLWCRYTLQTLDSAVKTGAGRVVMHSGCVRFPLRPPKKKLLRWLERTEIPRPELTESEEFVKLRDRVMKKIEKAAGTPLERIRESYARVIPMAEERDVELCLENREGLDELPLDAAFPAFLEELSDSPHVGYWHDTGHARIKEQLGLLDHGEHLAALAPRLRGFHLHDVSEDGSDHQVPGTGTVDFYQIAEFVRPEHTLVLELHPRLSADEVRAGREYLLKVFGE